MLTKHRAGAAVFLSRANAEEAAEIAEKIAAVYTKYNAVFFTAILAITIFYLHGWRACRDGAVLWAAALGWDRLGA